VTVSGGVASGQGYALARVNGQLIVDPAPLTITASAQTREYGLADPALGFAGSGFVNGETASVLTGGLVRAAGENVGSYSITQGSLAAANYTISFVGAQFIITRAPLAVSAQDVTRLYGAADPALAFLASGFRLGDTSASALTGGLVRAAGETVGSYAIGQGTLAAQNYAISFTSGDFSITPAPLAVAANPGSKIYGQADPALGFNASGFVLGDTVASLTGALARAPGENVGAYAITLGTLANPNYAISFSGALFTIDPASLTVVAFSQTREYGLADPPFAFSATGFVAGDTAATALAGALSRSGGENVGSYAITQGTLAAANYTIAFTPGSLEITPATLTVVADNQARAFGAPDPALTFQTAGLRLGDTAGSVLSGALARDAGETVGSYVIMQGT
ncbi:MAG: MBG domain-containing protein, partial [Sandaracinobacteroides sp.]